MGKKILIVKHGSFGDLVLSTGAIKTIRNHFPSYHICLLTSSKYIEFLEKSHFINEFITDERKPFYNIIKNFLILFKLISYNFDYIIDLQNSKRTFFYNIIFRLFTKGIISSSRPLAHYRYNIPLQGTEHVTIGLNKQLSLIGMKNFFLPNAEWLTNYKSYVHLKNPYVILIPGTSSKGIYKRWPSENYAEISNFLDKLKFSILVVGNISDTEAASKIFNSCPNAINFLGKSPPSVLYNLAKKAKFILSNDTGPAMLASLTDTPLLWIVNDNNISKSNKPTGKKVIKISSKSVRNISVEKVKKTLIDQKLI